MIRTKIFIFLCGIAIGISGFAGYLYYIDRMTKPDLEGNWEKVHVGMHRDKVKKLIGNPELMFESDTIISGTVAWTYGKRYTLFFLGNEVAVKRHDKRGQ